MQRIGTPIFTFFFTLLLFSCSTDETPSVSSSTYKKVTLPYKQVSGVDANLLSLDIYHFETTGATKPVVIYVHGGAWAIGDKANSITNKTNLFSSLGYVFVSVNYRLSPSAASSDPNRIQFPTHNEDVADAVKWVYDNVASYGGDKQKMVLLGHSAGAHLVSLTGTSAQFLPAKGISLATLTGVASIDTEGYDVVAQGNAGNETYLNAFGSNSADWTKASPIAQLVSGTEYPRFFIAKRGSNTRIALSDDFITKLQSVGVTVSQVTGSQYDHEGINDAIGAPNETIITDPLKAFLAQCFQ